MLSNSLSNNTSFLRNGATLIVSIFYFSYANNARQLAPISGISGKLMRISKRVCIIGAGATGFTTLKVLSERHQGQSGQWFLVAFEERDKVSGIRYRLPNYLFYFSLSDFLNVVSRCLWESSLDATIRLALHKYPTLRDDIPENFIPA